MRGLINRKIDNFHLFREGSLVLAQVEILVIRFCRDELWLFNICYMPLRSLFRLLIKPSITFFLFAFTFELLPLWIVVRLCLDKQFLNVHLKRFNLLLFCYIYLILTRVAGAT
jgi:hypothetical protein